MNVLENPEMTGSGNTDKGTDHMVCMHQLHREIETGIETEIIPPGEEIQIDREIVRTMTEIEIIENEIDQEILLEIRPEIDLEILRESHLANEVVMVRIESVVMRIEGIIIKIGIGHLLEAAAIGERVIGTILHLEVVVVVAVVDGMRPPLLPKLHVHVEVVPLVVLLQQYLVPAAQFVLNRLKLPLL